LIGFAPIDEQVKISQELRVMFKYFVIGGRTEFGMVAAAIQGKVDCVGYISHRIVLTPLSPRLMKVRLAMLKKYSASGS
jgi:hypothetical protein